MKFLLTVAAGVAIYHFLGTDKGKDMVGQVQKAASDLKDQLFKQGRDIVGKVKETGDAARYV
jgi:hypothetical protein